MNRFLLHIFSLSLFFVPVATNAQDPGQLNLDFEEWTDTLFGSGHIFDTIIKNRKPGVPVGWNAFSEVNAKTISQTTDASSGNYALVLSGFYQFQSAKLALGKFGQPGGMPITFQPAKITGNYKVILLGTKNDSLRGYVDVFLTKFDTLLQKRDTIATGHLTLFETPNEYQEFELPIEYEKKDITPDSIDIQLSKTRFGSSGADQDCYECGHVYFDNLRLSMVTKINSLPVEKEAEFYCYPNPFENGLIVKNTSFSEKDFQLHDITGRTLLRFSVKAKAALSIDATSLQRQMLFLTDEDRFFRILVRK